MTNDEFDEDELLEVNPDRAAELDTLIKQAKEKEQQARTLRTQRRKKDRLEKEEHEK